MFGSILSVLEDIIPEFGSPTYYPPKGRGDPEVPKEKVITKTKNIVEFHSAVNREDRERTYLENIMLRQQLQKMEQAIFDTIATKEIDDERLRSLLHIERNDGIQFELFPFDSSKEI